MLVIKVADAPLDADLAQFSNWLTGKGLDHRIVEERGEQAIYLSTPQYQEQVQHALALYLSDQHFKHQIDTSLPEWQLERAPGAFASYPRATPAQAPAIFVIVLLSVLVAWLTDFGKGGALLRALLILDPLQTELDLSTMSERWQGLVEMLSRGELWRLVSPDFLHFNIMHITFNLLMLWVLGGQLEIQKGSGALINMAVFVSLVSNIAQFLDSGYLFGGMSGVVYGLIGYCWVWRKLDSRIFLPEPIFKFSIVWLLVGYTPLTELLGWGSMANSAHLYGLLAGFIWGGLTLMAYKKAR